MTSRPIDPDFLAHPFRQLADVALDVATRAGAEHADFRFERVRYQHLGVRDGKLLGASLNEDLGFAVRVVLDGAWGFASGVVLTEASAARVAEDALEVARVARAMTTRRVQLAAEPVYDDAIWVSSYVVDPFEVSTDTKADLLRDWTARLLGAASVDHAAARLEQFHECKFYADNHGTRTTQQRVRVEPELTVYGTDESSGVFDSMRTIAPPVARGWEYLTGTGWDWDAELAGLPDLLAEKLVAPTIEPGRYDLVIHPSNLWLTIHESIGHATELDRALGYEANYAGTSFATPDKLGTLRYGSPIMHVTGDRTIEHGLATTGYDDEGVATQEWDIVKDGIFVGYQLDRPMAHTFGADLNGGRSNGCAYADSPGHIPIQRMANVSLQPDPDGPGTDQELIAQVEDGLYVVGDNSWSIDMQRYNFQFTGQQFHRIRNGRLVGQVRDAAYQATTTDFWGAMEVVGGPDTWQLGGAFNCGKAQPGQTAAVSHGAPTSLFRDIAILNAAEEAGQ